MYTLNASFGTVTIRFRQIRDHRDLTIVPTGLNLFRVTRAVEATVLFKGVLSLGQTFCSWKDLFDPDKGKVRALREAFATAGFIRPERAELWVAFFAAKPDREHKKERPGLDGVRVGTARGCC